MSRLHRALREVGSTALLIAAVLLGRASFADQYKVPSGSMEPTVEVGDHILVNKAAYGLRVPFSHRYLVRYAVPTRGDVVVLDAPDEDEVLLKRVVAGPGDVVAVHKGQVFINGQPIPWQSAGNAVIEEIGSHPHPLGLDRGGGPDFGPLALPEHRYLVLGDHRGDSRDGRYFGLVEEDTILGRALGVFWRGGPSWNRL